VRIGAGNISLSQDFLTVLIASIVANHLCIASVKVAKVMYLQAWLQGYDGRDPNRELEEFIKVENYLAILPTTPYYGDRD
jgi:hypothetical protein